MKKKFAFIISLVLCLVLCISLVACNNKDNNGNNGGNNGGNANAHTAKSTWSSDATDHWHDCATEGHTDKLDKAAHTWNDGEITTPPTEDADGVKTYTCTVCSAKKTEPVPQLEHTHTFDTSAWAKDASKHWHKSTCGHDVKADEADHVFGGWTVKTEAGACVDRVEERKCSVCEYTEERTITGTATHNPDYENIKHDETNHWYECGDCGEKVEITAHTYGIWSQKTAAADDQDKQYSRKCTACENEEVLTFDNTKTNGTYCVAITQIMKMSGKKYAVVQVLRGTIEVGDNFVIDGLDGTFEIVEIKDSKGKVITSASFGQSVTIEMGTEDGDLEQVDNRSVGGRLAYEPDSANAYTTFTAQIKVDLSGFSGALNSGRTVKLDLYNISTGMMDCSLVLPEGVNVAVDGESYVVTITLPDSRVLWAGMEFTCKVYVSASSSDVTVATGIILSVAN